MGKAGIKAGEQHTELQGKEKKIGGGGGLEKELYEEWRR